MKEVAKELKESFDIAFSILIKRRPYDKQGTTTFSGK